MDEFIPVNEPLLGEREKELVLECIESGWISSEGPFVEKFEESFSKKDPTKPQVRIPSVNGHKHFG